MYQRDVLLHSNGVGHKTVHQVKNKGMCMMKELKNTTYRDIHENITIITLKEMGCEYLKSSSMHIQNFNKFLLNHHQSGSSQETNGIFKLSNQGEFI